MNRFALSFLLSLCFALTLSAQQKPTEKVQADHIEAATATIPAEAAKQPNPVASTPESLERGKKWWTIDCAMCHGTSGNGKGKLAVDMKLTIGDFTDPATLKSRTDGELFYIIHNGKGDMPQEGTRVSVGENWDLVNYVRSLAKK